MNKKQTFTCLKYGKLISKLNDEMTNQMLRDDIFKFLYNFPGMLKYPTEIYELRNKVYRTAGLRRRGCLMFCVTTSSNIYIDFDGNNNFRFLSQLNKTSMKNGWMNINDIEYYVDKHSDDFDKIIDN